MIPRKILRPINIMLYKTISFESVFWSWYSDPILSLTDCSSKYLKFLRIRKHWNPGNSNDHASITMANKEAKLSLLSPQVNYRMNPWWYAYLVHVKKWSQGYDETSLQEVSQISIKEQILWNVLIQLLKTRLNQFWKNPYHWIEHTKPMIFRSNEPAEKINNRTKK